MRVTRPSLTTKESAARWPSSLGSTSPSRPLSLISIGSCTDLRLSAAHARATCARPRSGLRRVRAPAAVRRPDDVRVEHRDTALEVALGDRLACYRRKGGARQRRGRRISLPGRSREREYSESQKQISAWHFWIPTDGIASAPPRSPLALPAAAPVTLGRP